MKVLVVTHYYASHGGGIEIVAGRLIDELCHRGIAIRWAASDSDVPLSLAGLQTLPMTTWNLTERRLGIPYPLWSPSSLLRLTRAVKEADVVHIHDSLYLGNLCAFVVAKMMGTPVLVTQHIGEIPYRSLILRSLMRTANATAGRTVLSRADQVVFIADQVRRFYTSRFKLRGTPLLVMNGVDTSTFSDAAGADERANLRSTLGLDPTRPVFLFVGRFVEKKGIPLLRSLATALPRVQWVFAGWGPLDPAAWNLSQVRVFHRCSQNDLRKLYVAADLLVLPSVGEGFPLVVQESMACGTPAIVASETAAACPAAGPLILHEGVDGSSAPGRWTHRLETLSSDPALLKALRPQVAAFARERWSWTEAATAYQECFERLVATGRRGHPRTSSH